MLKKLHEIFVLTILDLPSTVNSLSNVDHELVAEALRANNNRIQQTCQYTVIIRRILQQTVERLVQQVLQVGKSLLLGV